MNRSSGRCYGCKLLIFVAIDAVSVETELTSRQSILRDASSCCARLGAAVLTLQRPVRSGRRGKSRARGDRRRRPEGNQERAGKMGSGKKALFCVLAALLFNDCSAITCFTCASTEATCQPTSWTGKTSSVVTNAECAGMCYVSVIGIALERGCVLTSSGSKKCDEASSGCCGTNDCNSDPGVASGSNPPAPPPSAPPSPGPPAPSGPSPPSASSSTAGTPTTSSIKRCYNCDSKTDPGCLSGALGAANGQNSRICSGKCVYTRALSGDDRKHVVRRCADYYTTPEALCDRKVSQVEYTCCSGNLCNSAPAAFFAPALTVAVAVTVAARFILE